ncbi:MAG: tetratricopeptide repeat protein [Polyangiaceae bacterium]|nr:tetratricopeptide repeat protein [Polyangiaceae bacterium]
MNQRDVFALLSVVGLVFGCAGAAPPPDDPTNPPPLDDPPGDVVPASSALVKEGMDAIGAGDFAKAKQVLERAHAENPKDPQAAYYLGVAQDNLGDGAAAKLSYQKALTLDPKLIEATVNLSALLLEAEGGGAEALALVDKALAHAPRDVRLLTNRALALEATGDMGKAVDAYKQAIAAGSDSLELRIALGQLLAQTGKKEDAKGILREVLASATQPEMLASMADAFGRLGAFADCVAALDKAIAKDEKPVLYVRRGVCRHEAKDDPGAQADYEKAVQLDPKFSPAYFYLGQHLRKVGKKKEAIAALQKAVELAGDQGVGPAAQKALADLQGKKK